MKVVMLAGGFGNRITEESVLRPKPMVEIGGMPIMWHIMKEYSVYGCDEFIICAGYKQHVIKEYFADYYLHRSDITCIERRAEQSGERHGIEAGRRDQIDTAAIAAAADLRHDRSSFTEIDVDNLV